MEKYYDLIVSLIKANRKYPGCEALLDDIVKDVYAHAEVVLSTVNNESVISSYLSKIVTTSMITVPRRLGIQVQRQNIRAIVNSQPEQTEQEHVSLPESGIVSENIISAEEISVDDGFKKNENLEEEIFSDNIEGSEIAETHADDELELSINADVDDVVVLQEDNNDEQPEESFEEAEDNNLPDVDKTLVDKMINGVINEQLLDAEELIEDETIVEDNELIEDNDDELLSQDDELIEDEAIVEDGELIEENDDELLSQDDELIEDETIVEDGELIENNDDELLSQDNELIEDESLINADETADIIQDFDSVESDLPDGTSLESVDSQEEYFEMQSDADSADEVMSFDTSEQEDLLADDIVEDEKNNSKSAGVKLYELFEFTPKKLESDYDNIEAEVQDMQSKHPELNIIEVFKLKYKDRLSISDIAEKLNISEDMVLDTLNELMCIVKD